MFKINTHFLTLFLTGIICCLSIIAYPQQGSFAFGVRGGFNLANVNGTNTAQVPEDFDGDATIENKLHSTFNAGVFAEYWLSSAFALQLNALYNNKGVKLHSITNGTFVEPTIGQTINVFQEVKQTVKLSYVSFPLMVKYAFLGDKNGGTKPFLFGGPEISILQSAETGDAVGRGFLYLEEFAGGGINIEESGTDVKDQFESLDAALNIGAGVQFSLGNVNGFVDGWYGFGLTKINKESNESLKNSVIYFDLGLIF